MSIDDASFIITPNTFFTPNIFSQTVLCLYILLFITFCIENLSGSSFIILIIVAGIKSTNYNPIQFSFLTKNPRHFK